jgi:hypothetical protein
MPASQRISLETNAIPETEEKPPQQKHHHHHRHGMGNHESFLVCPGRRPIKMGSNQPVSINIYFENFVNRNRNNNNGDNGEIYLRIKEGKIGENNINYNNHHANNHINAYHNELMNDENTSKAAEITSDNNNKGGDRIKNNLIKNNNHDRNNNNNCHNGEEEKDDGDVKHFINIYHRIVHSMADESATSGGGVQVGKPRIVVRSSSRKFS